MDRHVKCMEDVCIYIQSVQCAHLIAQCKTYHGLVMERLHGYMVYVPIYMERDMSVFQVSTTVPPITP